MTKSKETYKIEVKYLKNMHTKGQLAEMYIEAKQELENAKQEAKKEFLEFLKELNVEYAEEHLIKHPWYIK